MTVSTHCPAVNVPEVTPCDPAELDPLVAWLEAGQAATEAVSFPRGTALPDGRLDLCKQAIGPAGAVRIIDAVRANPHVRSILLGTDAIGRDGIAAIADVVSAQSSALETLYLGCNKAIGDDVAPLTDALAGDRTIKALWLKRNPLRAAGARRVARLLETNQSLEVLDLFNCELGDEGCVRVASALHSSESLRALDLGGNGMGVDACSALGDALAGHPSLEDLRIAASAIGDSGGGELARGLRQNRHLQRLDIASCDIGPRGADAIFDAIAGHPSIELVDARRFPAARALGQPPNRFGNAAGPVLASALTHAVSLRHLDLRNAGVASAGALVLERALERQPQIAYLGFARFVSRRIRRRVRALLDRNLAAGAEPMAEPSYVAAIRSVYR